MPYPAQPSLLLATLSSTSFQATVSNGNNTDVMRLFYRKVGDSLDIAGPTLVGNGVMPPLTGLTTNGQYQVYVIADNGSSYSQPSYAYISLAQSDLLSTAVHAHFGANPVLASLLSGGLWTGEIPEGTTPPYAWLDIAGGTTTPLFIDVLDRSRFIVHIYAIGAASAEACAQQFKAVFDFQTLPFQTNASVWCKPLNYRLVPEKARWKDGTLMYRAVLSYDVLTQIPTS